MRDCVFLVADSNMAHLIKGLLTRDQFHRSLQCGPFSFDPTNDLVVADEKDPGIYTRAHETLRSYESDWRHAMILLDEEWEGSPGSVAIKQKIEKNLIRTGWQRVRFEVIVIEPELENWVWIDSPHVSNAFGFRSFQQLRAYVTQEGFWLHGANKPARPKEAVESALKASRLTRSSSRYLKIGAEVSVRKCTDPAFHQFRSTLDEWFS